MNRVPEAKFLNLEYFFNQFFKSLRLLLEKFLAIAEWLSKLGWFSVFVSLVALAGIIFLLFKIFYLKRKKIVHIVDALVRKEVPEMRTDKWDEISKKLESENSSDWKMAIIEADSLIDEIIKGIGYKGDDLGERLKVIEPSDFDNLQNVWEAHKVRNKIVHEGESFELTKEVAKETIEKYKKALKELKYI